MAATAQPIDTTVRWDESIDQPSLIVNENFLRLEVLVLPVLSIEATQPVSPAEGALYILGAAWGDEVTGTLAYYRDGAWTYWTPFEGQVKYVGSELYIYSSGSWAAGSSTAVAVPTATISTATHLLLATDCGKYNRFTYVGAKTLTVQDNADEAVDTDKECHGRNASTGDLTIVEDTAVTVNPPAGGTLVIPPGGTFTLKKVGADEWDLFGLTVSA